MYGDAITLTRDCPAAMIPAGTPVTLQAGEKVYLTQSLGGSYTVVINGNMARVSGIDADALGLTADAPIEANALPPGQEVDSALIWKQLKTVFDPEIPVNIVDLGLVYDMKVTPLGSGGHRAEVKMTLTAPGCGMGEVLRADVKEKLLRVPGIIESEAELVWEPAWNQGLMSEAAQLQLGIY